MTDYTKMKSPALLLEFEKASYSGETQKAFDILVSGIFQRIEHKLFIPECISHGFETNLICTRFISAYIRFIKNNNHAITDDGYFVMIKYIAHVRFYYEASTFYSGTNDCFIATNNIKKYDQKKQLLLSTFYLLDTQYLKHFSPKYSVPYFLSILATRMVLTKDDERHRHLSMQHLSKSKFSDISDLYMDRLSSAWMFCSYAPNKDKHDVKINLNRMLRDWAINNGFQDKYHCSDTKHGKPVAVVCAEKMTKKHAMYRCHGASLASLSEFFYVILIADKHDIDKQDYDWVDETIRLDVSETGEITLAMEKVYNLSPDVVIYPSLGMNYWTLPLSVMRIAPVQILLMGHPATSNSPMIDYIIIDDDCLSSEKTVSERIIKLRKGSTHFVDYPDARFIEPTKVMPSNTINILIASATMKLNYKFFKVCKRIKEQATKKVIFNFFPYESDLELDHFIAKVKLLVSEDICAYRFMPYDDYMSFLNNCDLMLSPFPFGSSNSNVDATKQGIPVICLDGDEIHSHIDAVMMSRIGQPAWLSTSTEEEYINAALRLIEDDQLRGEIHEKLVNTNVMRALNCSSEMELGHAVCMAYKYNSEIKALEKKCYSLAELKEMLCM